MSPAHSALDPAAHGLWSPLRPCDVARPRCISIFCGAIASPVDASLRSMWAGCPACDLVVFWLWTSGWHRHLKPSTSIHHAREGERASMLGLWNRRVRLLSFPPGGWPPSSSTVSTWVWTSSSSGGRVASSLWAGLETNTHLIDSHLIYTYYTNVRHDL